MPHLELSGLVVPRWELLAILGLAMHARATLKPSATQIKWQWLCLATMPFWRVAGTTIRGGKPGTNKRLRVCDLRAPRSWSSTRADGSVAPVSLLQW